MRFVYKGTDQLAWIRFRYYMRLATKATSVITQSYWLKVAKAHSIK